MLPDVLKARGRTKASWATEQKSRNPGMRHFFGQEVFDFLLFLIGHTTNIYLDLRPDAGHFFGHGVFDFRGGK